MLLVGASSDVATMADAVGLPEIKLGRRGAGEGSSSSEGFDPPVTERHFFGARSQIRNPTPSLSLSPVALSMAKVPALPRGTDL